MRRVTAAVFALLTCLTIGCAQAAALAVHYSDVDGDSPAGQAILEMTRRGVISGVTETTFAPDEPISAADYVTMLAKLRSVTPSATDSTAPDAGYMQAALNLHWYDWDEIPPDDPAASAGPVTRELAANILVAAFFGNVAYDWSTNEQISDFSEVSGRYYEGVLGGLTLGLFNHQSGTPFYPLKSLSRADACLWAANALAKSNTPGPPPQNGLPTPDASPAPSVAAAPTAPAVRPAGGGVSQNGWLQVKGTQLCNEAGDPVVLHGMSSMGIQWYPQYTSLQSIQNTIDRGANVFRIAMYVEDGGYLSDKPKFRALVEEIVANAVTADVYVIIDWHILSDGNPMTHHSEAEVFFDEMSQKYADTPNVIYEICNEPNGNITWSGDVKPYAEQITAVIRKNSPRGVILIGNPMWDQDVDVAAADPVAGTNLMYTLHFYAGTHHQELRDKATRALEMGAPIFVSEWGTSDASGSGGVFLESSDQWLAYMAERDISWCNWSLCDKEETSAALVPGAPADATWTQADLSESGRYVFSRFMDEQSSASAPAVSPSPSADASPVKIVPVTAEDAINQFRSESEPGATLVVRNADDAVLSGDDIVSTGCIIQELDEPDDAILHSAVIVVRGDVLGTGMIDLSQLVRMAQAVAGVKPLDGLDEIAADLDGEQGIGLTDLVMEAKYLIDGGDMTCTFLLRDRAA